MNLSKEIEFLKKKHFQLGAFIIASVLGVFGFGFLLYSDIFAIKSFEDFVNVLSYNGLYLIFGGFFFLLFIYVVWLFFINLCFKPKKEVLYLVNEDEKLYFVNRRGKKIFCDKITVKKEGFYNVWKTKHYVLRILNKSNKSWSVKNKKSFWLTWYSPLGCIEDILLLPIIYVVFLFLIVQLIFGNASFGLDSIIGIVPIVFIILFDLLMKYVIK